MFGVSGDAPGSARTTSFCFQSPRFDPFPMQPLYVYTHTSQAPLRMLSHPMLLSALQQQQELPLEPPPPMPPSGLSSVWGSFRRMGRETGAHPSLLCCLSLPLPLPSLLRVTFHPSLGCPSKAAPVVNNFCWQPHTKPGPETIVPGTMAEQPNNEAATVLSDILRCPGKGGGAVGFAMPSPPAVELFPLAHGGSSF